MNKQRILAAAFLASLLGSQVAQAQSVTPMRATVRSFTDSFAVRLTVGNPYDRPVLFDLKVYDENFEPVDVPVVPAQLRIGPQNTKLVMVSVPFEEQAGIRKVRVCAEGTFGKRNEASVRTQVCGKFLGQRL